MAVVRWEPFRELAALQSEMSRFMNQGWGGQGSTGGNGASTWLPAVDVWETDKDLVVAFDLPGIAEEEVAIEIDESVLTVSGERKRELNEEGNGFFRFERRFGAFSRSVTLPQGIDSSKIKAEFANGVLEIHVPKPEERKPKRIQIGSQGAIEGKSTRRK
jgi:HSP20 family protein